MSPRIRTMPKRLKRQIKAIHHAMLRWKCMFQNSQPKSGSAILCTSLIQKTIKRPVQYKIPWIEWKRILRRHQSLPSRNQLSPQDLQQPVGASSALLFQGLVQTWLVKLQVCFHPWGVRACLGCQLWVAVDYSVLIFQGSAAADSVALAVVSAAASSQPLYPV